MIESITIDTSLKFTDTIDYSQSYKANNTQNKIDFENEIKKKKKSSGRFFIIVSLILLIIGMYVFPELLGIFVALSVMFLIEFLVKLPNNKKIKYILCIVFVLIVFIIFSSIIMNDDISIMLRKLE